ncbi:MAG: hypothetical protein E5W97_29425 [Mesorhizobium sp.]|nr:MAG: hypothetical protein E5W97_29425 [Mesorhizobium sp.]
MEVGSQSEFDLVRNLIEEEKADIYQYSGEISKGGLHLLQESLEAPRHHRAILTLTTGGGDGVVAYQIARHFHRVYERLTVYVPRFCMSAGTFVVLGAHDLIMHPNAMIGPIDPQFRKFDEICMRESALTSRAALAALGEAAFGVLEQTACELAVASEAAVSFKLGGQVGANLAAGLLSPLVAKLNPTIVGTEHRAIGTAIEYGKRLVRASGNATEETVNLLVTGYPSHDFAIDYREVCELFKNVSEPSELLTLHAWGPDLPDDITVGRHDPQAPIADADSLGAKDQLASMDREAA